MQSELQTQVAFYLTGKAPAEGLDAVGGLGLRPAVLAAYRDLTTLRYDYPVVLAQDADAPLAESLSGAVDRALAELAADERVQKQALSVEREIRVLLGEGARGTLSALWSQAAERLGAAGDEKLAANLGRVRTALKLEGEVLDCSESLPGALLRHGWNRVQQHKALSLRGDVDRLILKLNDILGAEYVHSDAGLSPQALKAAVGTTYGDAIDFQAMSKLLAKTMKRSLTKARRERVCSLIATLKSHRFSPSKAVHAGDSEPFNFVFTHCGQALKAFRERLPKMVELARALEVAKLEIAGEYHEDRHDALFESFGASGLDAKDMALFPSYLVCVNAAALDGAESARLTEILSSGLPMKVLVQSDDLLEAATPGGRLAVGLRARQFASLAMGLNEVYVVQSSASHLVQYRDRLERGLEFAGPALFNVYSGAAPGSQLAPYLNAAAAMESRAFPAYVYDPSAGADWASRFELQENPQADREWPVQAVPYEDAEHQRNQEESVFTLADFVACDPRFAGHFARVPRERWNGTLSSMRDFLAAVPEGMPEKLPYLPMVDSANLLQKVIVDDVVVRETRRCADLWRSLQELGGIRNSHAERLLQREKAAWEEKLRAAEAAAKATAAAAPAAAAPATAAAAAAPVAGAVEAAPAEAEKASSDEPYIETPRCTTCEECVRLNGKMFLYDGNKQAYIGDLSAGTYKQLVEAAENCQVSIIHPGKPKNPGEPGLEELLKRAEPFL